MSGHKHRATETATVSSTNFFGILYAEDFDDPTDDPSTVHQTSAVPEVTPLTQADLDAACIAAVQAARQEWEREDEHHRATGLLALETALTGIRETAEQSALATAEATVVTILSMITGLLPEFCREHGPTEVRALLARVLPTIRSPTMITVRVHPDLVSAVQRDISTLDPDSAAMITVAAASIERGDVKVGWENGSMTRDSRQIVQAIQDALSQLGLHHKVEAPTKRIMAYAD